MRAKKGRVEIKLEPVEEKRKVELLPREEKVKRKTEAVLPPSSGRKRILRETIVNIPTDENGDSLRPQITVMGFI